MKFTKYSMKCQSFIDDNFKDVFINHFNNIDNNDLINNIKSIIKTTAKSSEYKIKTVQLNKIHQDTELPLFFILCDHIYKSGIADEIFNKFTGKFTLLNVILWLRKHQNEINLLDISNKILKSNNEDMLTLYSLLYKLTDENARYKLHELLYINPFVSLDIQHHAESVDIIYNEIIYENGFKLHLYHIENDTSVDINMIYHIVETMHNIAQQGKSKTTQYPELTIFSGKQMKQFTNYDNNICSENINSGSTIVGVKVSIWRYEELYKVLIHELIHYYGFDFHYRADGYKTLEKYISTNFCIDGFDRSNESYTETLAVIIHSLLISHYMDIPLNKLLEKEMTFSILQIVKLLKFFNITNIDEIYKKHNQNQCDKSITQYTSALSYFIIKSSLLFSYNNFVDFIGKKLIISDRIDKFTKLINVAMYNNKFIDIINNTLNNNIINNNKFIGKTLRMTCLQIE
jgi:hypothetical protein